MTRLNPWTAILTEEPIVIARAGEAAAHQQDAAVTATHQEIPAKHAEQTTHGKQEEHGEHASQWVFFSFSMIAFVLIVLFMIAATRKMRLIPQGMQNVLEWLYETVCGIPEMVMGARGRQYAPIIASFFFYIIVMNFLGLIPAFKPGTASLSITLGLSIVAFFAVQFYGFQAHGWRYLAHFLGPVPAMAILILPLELVAEMVRPMSLSIRLYGNIFGEEQVVSALANQLHPLAALIILPIQILSAFLQAYVFSLLVTVYISLATEKHDKEHEASANEAAAH